MSDWQPIETAPMDGTEVWRAVHHWPTYEVSSDGRVRSLPRRVVRKDGTVQTWKGKIMSPSVTSHGYLTVRLSRPEQRVVARVHRLVAQAFLPSSHTTETVNHKNGVKTDNRVENLEWATRAENVLHAIENGLGAYLPPCFKGDRHPAHKIKDHQVRQAAKDIAANRATLRGRARELGVDHSTLSGRIKSLPL
jgi:hypothetical protein